MKSLLSSRSDSTGGLLCADGFPYRGKSEGGPQNFDAWGRNRNPNTWQYASVSAVPTWLYRGYTGHEHLKQFALINMNGRMYDPVQGRMLSPDNYVSTPFGTQGYNRYSYANNNPLSYISYTDPDGQLIQLAIAAAIGGLFNLMMADMNGNIGSFWDGLKYFGVGAAAGAASAFTSGAVAGTLGFGGFAGGAITGAAGGFTGGLIGGAGNSWLNGSSFGNGLVNGLKAGGIGALTGGVVGGISGGIDAVRNSANFWDGKVSEIGGSSGSGGKFLDETVPAGHKPTSTGEIATTSGNPNYGKYGYTRSGGKKPHFGIDYVGEIGDDVFAMYDGKVIQVGGSNDYGKYFVRTSSQINSKLYNVDYGHMSKAFVKVGATVTSGDVIGSMGRLGNLGTSFPTHVHIAIWRPIQKGLQGFVMPSWK